MTTLNSTAALHCGSASKTPPPAWTLTVRLYGDALGHQKDDAADLVKLFALLGRIRLVSPRPVVTAAERTFDAIVETYLGPNRTMHEVLDDVRQGGFNFLMEFGEACRQDLARD